MVHIFSSSFCIPSATSNDSEKDFDRLNTFLKLLNLFELKQELEQPISPITSLSDLCQKTDSTLQVLEVTFAEVSDSCSHWTLNSLFGSNVIASYLEKLIHQLFNPDLVEETLQQRQIRKFSHSLVSEITVSVAINYLGLLSSINPILSSLGIISAALGETLIQSALNIVSVQSFAIFTQLIRQRLTEYSEFKNFIPEYRLYTHFFHQHHYNQVYNLQINDFPDHLQIFKLIHSFSGVTNRGNLLNQLILILEKDAIFQARLEEKFSRLGRIFWKLVSILGNINSQKKK
ncbi:MAG: hypothetical protein QNJ60_04645 [Xenococcaceae cyanobacterium MO_188.B19]|nr:hypothetical protein [Xenococcaceae cyanobacterium MO_188.B19]